MKKWTLNQGLSIYSVTKHKIIFVSNAHKKFHVPKTEEKLLNFLAQGLKTEKEIRDWMKLNDHEWTFETLTNSGILTNHFIDPKDKNSREDVFFNLFEEDVNYGEVIRSKTLLLIGGGGIGSHILQYFSRANIKKIIVVDGDKIEMSNLNRQILFDVDDIGKDKIKVLEEKVKKYSTTEVVGLKDKIESTKQLEKISNEFKVDFVVLSADSDVRLIKWCYDVFSLKGIPVTISGYIGTMMVSGPILDSKNKTFEDSFNNINSVSYLNKDFENAMAPSSIFMNSFISAYTAGEVLKYWSSKWKPETINKRIIIDFLTWQKHTFSLKAEE